MENEQYCPMLFNSLVLGVVLHQYVLIARKRYLLDKEMFYWQLCLPAGH